MIGRIEGFRVGHWTDVEAGTGCTAILPPQGAVAAVDVGGGGTSARETDLLAPTSSVRMLSALVFTGGSAFGLDAASGVVRWCEERGLGRDTGAATVPLVSAAVIYDLGITAGRRRPGAEEGYAACVAAADGAHAVGSVGAGTGATVGKLLGQAGWCKGGLGAAAVTTHDGAAVAALAVVNCWGDVVDDDGSVLAGAWRDGSFVGAARRAWSDPPEHPRLAADGQNTTLVCVATDAALSGAEADRVARMAHTGLARAVHPVNTPIDGDAAFCLASGRVTAAPFAVGAAAAWVSAEAVRDAVRSAEPVRGVPTAEMRLAGRSG